MARQASRPQRPLSSALRSAAAVILFAALPACERGCLGRWLADRSGAAQDKRLDTPDCPEGRARCSVDGVSFSPGRPDCVPSCQCAWELVKRCKCVVEGLELVRGRDEVD